MVGKYKRAFPPSRGQNRDAVWKRNNWDKWTFWGKAWHVVCVILCGVVVLTMCAGAAYLVLIYFGVLGFVMEVRDTVLLALAHWLFD